MSTKFMAQSVFAFAGGVTGGALLAVAITVAANALMLPTLSVGERCLAINSEQVSSLHPLRLGSVA